MYRYRLHRQLVGLSAATPNNKNGGYPTTAYVVFSTPADPGKGLSATTNFGITHDEYLPFWVIGYPSIAVPAF